MTTKVCKQCGELKPQDQFRPYYGGRKGHYNTCKLCEKINSREKYLARKAVLSAEDQKELQDIHELWSCQVKLGLKPPRAVAREPLKLDELVGKYAELASKIPNIPAAPPELIKWLTEPLTAEPEYYQEGVYTELSDRYRPQLRIDTDTMLPVYDDTYKEVLHMILERFDAYEDKYYG